MSFEESSALLHELAGVEVSVKQAERAAEALGAGIADDERRCVEKMGEVAPSMYLGMDGTGVPVRAAEVAGRTGIRDQSRIRPRLKVPLLQIRTPSGAPSPRAYYAKPRDEVLPKPPACAVLGDGSAWIWNTTAELFPQATQILDRYHAKEALHRTTQTIFGATSEGEVWVDARCQELDEGKQRAIVHALRLHAVSSDEPIKCAMYIFRKRARMRYPKFRAQGLCTSTVWRKRHHRPPLLQTQWTL